MMVFKINFCKTFAVPYNIHFFNRKSMNGVIHIVLCNPGVHVKQSVSLHSLRDKYSETECFTPGLPNVIKVVKWNALHLDYGT